MKVSDTHTTHSGFLLENPNKLVVIKYAASYCRSCQALKPRFLAIKNDQQLVGLPIVWAEFESKRSNKELFRKLGVLTLPTIHFHDGYRGIIENFPCPPAQVKVLKKKLARFVNARVDPVTLELVDVPMETHVNTKDEPAVRREIVIDNELITGEHIQYLRHGMPFFRELTDQEFDVMLRKARLLTFDPGNVIMKQGMPGEKLYVLKRGTVEMCIKSRFDDPISTPPNYLGAVVNTLKKFDYFGERALTTGEPFAASFRVLDKVRCFAFHVNDIPESSILNQKRLASQEMIDQLSRRYKLPENYKPTYVPVTPQDQCVLELLVRFKQIRQAAKCFDYVIESGMNWSDPGEIARRSILVSKLSNAQREEFYEIFNMVDTHRRGQVCLLELRLFMESARKTKAQMESIVEMMNRSSPAFNGKTDHGITLHTYMGIMAEAEFYNLFKETFEVMDPKNTGYVRAGDLDEILGTVRDLISSDDQTGLIDLEDQDMLVDYQQFTRMLLGVAL